MHTNYCDGISISDQGVNSIRSIPGGWIVCLSELTARLAAAGTLGAVSGGLGAIVTALGVRVVLGMATGAAGVFGGIIPAFCCEVRMSFLVRDLITGRIRLTLIPEITFHNFRRQ